MLEKLNGVAVAVIVVAIWSSMTGVDYDGI